MKANAVSKQQTRLRHAVSNLASAEPQFSCQFVHLVATPFRVNSCTSWPQLFVSIRGHPFSCEFVSFVAS